MSDKAYLDDNGNIIKCSDLIYWAVTMENNNRRIGLDIIKVDNEEIKVSTVFLGLNHNFGDGPDLWFETMIFGGINDGWQDRYSTREQALIGHQKAIEIAKSDKVVE